MAEPEQVIEYFRLQRSSRYDTSYNICPGQKILTVVQIHDGTYKAVNLWWGLIPSWSKDRNIAFRLINARVETVADKPAFRDAYRERRCLIPATGFYEWQKLEKCKQTHHICKSDGSLFAFAGLWESWNNGQETLYSCTIITTEANALMRPVHKRMPVIIGAQQYKQWLNPSTPVKALKDLLTQDSYQAMTVTLVSDWVNNPSHDDERCLK